MCASLRKTGGQAKQAGMLSPIDALRRVLEVLTLGPCGPLLVKHSARLLRALKAVDWTQLKANANRAQVRRGDARAAHGEDGPPIINHHAYDSSRQRTLACYLCWALNTPFSVDMLASGSLAVHTASPQHPGSEPIHFARTAPIQTQAGALELTLDAGKWLCLLCPHSLSKLIARSLRAYRSRYTSR